MRKNILILISIILVVVLMMYALKLQEIKKDRHSKSTHSDTTLQHAEKPILTPETTHPSSKKNEPLKSLGTSKTTPSKMPSIQTRILYKTLSLEEANMITKEKRHIKPVTAITLNSDTFNSLQTGDSLTLPDIDGIDYTLNVVDVQTYENGATSTTAKYEDEGVTYTTTITHSANETFITLATAQGMYEIETSQGTGYVYDSSHIRKQLQRPNKNDMIVLPVPKR